MTNIYNTLGPLLLGGLVSLLCVPHNRTLFASLMHACTSLSGIVTMQTALYTSVYRTDTTWLRCMVSRNTTVAYMIAERDTGLWDMVCIAYPRYCRQPLIST